MSFSSFSIEKLIHSCDNEKRRISQIERAIFEIDKEFVVDKEIALDKKRFRFAKMTLTMINSLVLVENSLIVIEVQLDKVVDDHEFSFVTIVDVSLSLDRRFVIRIEID